MSRSLNNAIASQSDGRALTGFQFVQYGAGTVTTTQEMIASFSSASEFSQTFPYKKYSGGFTVQIAAGGNAEDAPGETGASAVLVRGLDDTGALQREVIPTAGESASAGSLTWSRVYDAIALGSGSNETNVGAITVEDSSNRTLALIPAGNGNSTATVLTVPTGYKAHVHELKAWTEANKAVEIDIFIRANGLTTSSPRQSVRKILPIYDITRDKPLEYTAKIAPILPQGTDIWIEGSVASGTATTSTAMSFTFIKT